MLRVHPSMRPSVRPSVRHISYGIVQRPFDEYENVRPLSSALEMEMDMDMEEPSGAGNRGMGMGMGMVIGEPAAAPRSSPMPPSILATAADTSALQRCRLAVYDGQTVVLKGFAMAEAAGLVQ
jgi:hypothetical protein